MLGGRLTYPRWCVEGASSTGDWLRRVAPQCVVATVRPRFLLGRLRLEQTPRTWRILPLALVLPLVVLPAFIAADVVRGYVAMGVAPATAVRVAMSPWRTSSIIATTPLPREGEALIAVCDAGQVTLEPLSRFLVQAPSIEAVPPQDDGSIWTDSGGVSLVTDAGRPIVLMASSPPKPASGPPSPGVTPAVKPWAPGARPQVSPPGPVNLARVIGSDRMWVMPHQGYRITVTEIAAARAATAAPILIPPPRAMAARFVLGPAINSLILVAMLLLPLPVATITFLALPVMRHRHRIRLAHLWRLAAYAALGASVAGATVVLVADLIPSLAGLRVFAGRIRYEGLIRAVGGESSSRAATLAWAACLILPIIGTTIWWTWATNRYLRLSRPLPVALAVAAVGSLASLAVLQSAFGVLV